MRVNEESEDDPRNKWTPIASELHLPQLAQLEGDGVNIQCVNSSEFVVGKQTNFNGPVTIINCPNPKPPDPIEIPKEEMIVIKQEILSQSAMTRMEEMGKGSKHEGIQVKKPKFLVKTWIIVFFAVIVFLTAAAVSLAVLLDKQEVTDPDSGLPICKRLSKNVCLYSEFSFARKHHDTRPLTVPAPYVVISQTCDYFCYNLDQCLTGVKVWFEKDTFCNFLLGGDGNVYEDLGWGEQTLHGNTAAKSIQFCFMGDYTGWEIPTYPQVEATKTLIEFAVENGHLASDYILAPSNATSRGDLEPSNNSTHHFYSKTDWGGQPPKSFVLMKTPVPYVVVSHSASTECSSLATCSPLIQGIQNYHQSIDYADIAYNFLLDSSGNIYEGRGWVTRNVKGGFTNGRNIDVCLLGDFSDTAHPSEEQMKGLGFFLDFGIKNGYLSPEYSLIAANATYATLSPGVHVYEIMKNWPHFDPDPMSRVKDFEK